MLSACLCHGKGGRVTGCAKAPVTRPRVPGEPIPHRGPCAAVGRSGYYDDVAAGVFEAVQRGIEAGGIAGRVVRQHLARALADRPGRALQRAGALAAGATPHDLAVDSGGRDERDTGDGRVVAGVGAGRASALALGDDGGGGVDHGSRSAMAPRGMAPCRSSTAGER